MTVRSTRPSGDGIANFLDCRDGVMDAATGVGVAGFDDLSQCMTDADGDDYGDAAVAPGGGLVAGTDCDDGDASISPGAIPTGSDVGNGLDRDCDGFDECFFDADADGYGSTVTTADNGDGVCDDFLESWQATDCNNYDHVIFPGAPVADADVGDGVDRDCDGFDECYADADGDGYGGGTFTADDGDGVCDDAGEDIAVRDCNDSATLISPGATPTAQDVGNGVDRDCDGLDECFFDADADGYGGAVVADDGDGTCDDAPETVVGGDCEDDDSAVHPEADEVCDGVDNDCVDGIDDDFACGVPDAGPTEPGPTEPEPTEPMTNDDAGMEPQDAATDAGVDASGAIRDAATGIAGMSSGDPVGNQGTGGTGSGGNGSTDGSASTPRDASIDEASVGERSPDGCNCRIAGRSGRDGAVIAWFAVAIAVGRLRRRRSRGAPIDFADRRTHP